MLNKYHNHCDSGGLNLELSLIIALLVITSVAGLTFLAKNISNEFITAGELFAKPIPTPIPTLTQTSLSDKVIISITATSTEKTIVSYEIQKDNEPTFIDPVSTIIPATQTTYEATALPGQNLYLRAVSIDSKGNKSEWSNTLSYSADVASATPIFIDNFNRANNATTIGNGWSQAQDTSLIKGINDNKMALASNSTNAAAMYAYRTKPTFNDTVLSTKYYHNNDGLAILSMSTVNGYWYNSAFNGYSAIFSNFGVRIVRESNYISTDLATKYLSINSGDTIAFKRFGDSLITYVNGIQVLTATDSTYKNFISVGAYLSINPNKTSQLDDFAIYNVNDYPNVEYTPIINLGV